MRAAAWFMVIFCVAGLVTFTVPGAHALESAAYKWVPSATLRDNVGGAGCASQPVYEIDNLSAAEPRATANGGYGEPLTSCSTVFAGRAGYHRDLTNAEVVVALRMVCKQAASFNEEPSMSARVGGQTLTATPSAFSLRCAAGEVITFEAKGRFERLPIREDQEVRILVRAAPINAGLATSQPAIHFDVGTDSGSHVTVRGTAEAIRQSAADPEEPPSLIPRTWAAVITFAMIPLGAAAAFALKAKRRASRGL